MGLFNDVRETISTVYVRIKNRDFSGNTGLAVKNSVFQIGSVIASKFGSFLFTIIMARLLMPELFGLYSLSLSTVLVFVAVSELGISQSLIRFLSKESEKKRGKSVGHLKYFTKVKLFLTITSIFGLIVLAKIISENFYQKPIFLALLAGSLYILSSQTVGFLQSILQASNYFKGVFWKEISFQVARAILAPLVVIFALRNSFSDEGTLMLVMIFLSVSFFLAGLFLAFDVKKIYSNKIKSEKRSLSVAEKIRVRRFIMATAILATSGTFFGNIDKIILGKFAQAEYVGYYTAAFGLIGAFSPLIGFAAVVLLPMFSKLKGKRLEESFRKSRALTLLMSLVIVAIILILSNLVIFIVYGQDYAQASGILRVLALLLLIIPLTAIYQSYYISQGRVKKVARLLIGVTLLNIVLNYILISWLISYGPFFAIYGAAIATLMSRLIYLSGLILGRRKLSNKKYFHSSDVAV